jgi:hypothetical protein
MRGGWSGLSLLKRAVLVVLVLAFLWFVWPSPYAHWSDGSNAWRRNRITGQVQQWWDGRWR